MRTSLLLVAICLLTLGGNASAVTISFNGVFGQDDDVVLFQYTVATTGPVTVSTTSFVGGGFSPILSVFDSTGQFLFENVGYSNSPISDATLLWNSVGGELYIVALSEYDNQAVGSQTSGNLSEGFVRDGQGNFTAQPPFNPTIPGGSFLLPGPEQRTSAWAVDFTSADPTLQVTMVPEPSSGLLLLGGVLLISGRVFALRRKRLLNRLD